METDTNPQEPLSREALRSARRVLIKVGTSIVANNDGSPSLTRLGAISEQISELIHSGKQVIFVSSGAVGMGKRLLRRQMRKNMTFNDLHYGVKGFHDNSMSPNSSFSSLLETSRASKSNEYRKKQYDLACAAAGQFEMMSFYSSLFGQCEISASQILVTQEDFQDDFRLRNLSYAIERLLSLGILPIINENDAVSANSGYTTDDIFSDNDSLAAICARSFDVEVVLLLTDVDGVYNRPPTMKGARMLRFYRQNENVTVGKKSVQGRGGMGSKIDAAIDAVKPGALCTACIVASGSDLNSIRSILGSSYDAKFGPPKGTLFATPGTDLWDQCFRDVMVEDTICEHSVLTEIRLMSISARNEAQKIMTLPYSMRQIILNAIADAILSNKDLLFKANNSDLEAATNAQVSALDIRRLKLTNQKLLTLADDIRYISQLSDPLGVFKIRRELSDGLELSQITVPIGLVMVIYQSHMESIPQILALALVSGNGVILKGENVALQSISVFHHIIGDVIEISSQGKIRREIISLVSNGVRMAEILSLDDNIDLVIPQGDNALVSYVKANTRIPVLGNTDCVCHVYIAPTAAADAAVKIAVDSKTHSQLSHNTMNTLLLHEGTLKNGVAMKTMMNLRLAGIKCLGGPDAMKAGLCDISAVEMKDEYRDLICTVEVVKNIDEAIDWIHKYGTGHTEAIVCGENDPFGDFFLKRVDASCVFKNASTRFADGYRFGFGAEVAFSTGRIHSRGPVGVDGLLTTKWQLKSKSFNYITEYEGDAPIRKYTHKDLN